MMVQPPLWSLFVLTWRATRAASVKASLTPRFFMAEHSATHVSIFGKQLTVHTRDGIRTEVAQRLDLLGHLEALIVVDHWLLGLPLFVVIAFPLSQVALERHQNEFDAWTVLGNLSHPLRLNVLERIGRVDLFLTSEKGLAATTELKRTLKQSIMA